MNNPPPFITNEENNNEIGSKKMKKALMTAVGVSSLIVGAAMALPAGAQTGGGLNNAFGNFGNGSSALTNNAFTGAGNGSGGGNIVPSFNFPQMGSANVTTQFTLSGHSGPNGSSSNVTPNGTSSIPNIASTNTGTSAPLTTSSGGMGGSGGLIDLSSLMNNNNGYQAGTTASRQTTNSMSHILTSQASSLNQDQAYQSASQYQSSGSMTDQGITWNNAFGNNSTALINNEQTSQSSYESLAQNSTDNEGYTTFVNNN
jgi:hypothetical protein